jgi:hypothetical protein
MKDKPDTPSSVKMEQARKLMDQGRHQEALELALDGLLEELNRLRDTLQALQLSGGPEWLASAPDIQEEEEPSPSEPDWLPPVKPRILH